MENADGHLLTVVVPTYNEGRTLELALDRLRKVDLPVGFEIVIVDDGSTDGSIDTLIDPAGDQSLRVVKHDRNLGKGAAIRTGIEHAQGDILVILDADLEYDPQDYRSLLQPILDGDTDVAYGTREFGAHTAFSFWFVLGNKAVNFWASFLYNTWLTDVETCFKMARIEAWRELDLRSRGFGVEAEATGRFLLNGHRIYEVPISYRARTREEGKKLRWSDGLEAVWILLRVRLLR